MDRDQGRYVTHVIRTRPSEWPERTGGRGVPFAGSVVIAQALLDAGFIGAEVERTDAQEGVRVREIVKNVPPPPPEPEPEYVVRPKLPDPGRTAR